MYLVLTWMSCSIRVLLKRTVYYMLVRIVVRLGVHGELQALKVLIIVNVFPQMYMGFLEIGVVEIPGIVFDIGRDIGRELFL